MVPGKSFFGESMFHRWPNASNRATGTLPGLRGLSPTGLPGDQSASEVDVRWDIPREDFLELLARGALGPDGEREKVKLPAFSMIA